MKNLRIYWLPILLLILGGQVSAQEKSGRDEGNLYSFVTTNFDKESFLIGTLNDYMGHQHVFTFGRDSSFLKNCLLDIFLSEGDNSENLKMIKESTKRSFYDQFVDGYFPNEKSLALLINSLFTNEFSDLRMVDKGCEGRCINLYSPSLSKIIDGYFEYRPGSAKTVFMDTIYVGYHKVEKLQTDKQKLSFLAGALLRDGYKTESEGWVLSMPNSISKAKLCVELLKEFGCKNVEYDILKDYIPVGHKIHFEPSKTVSELIKKVETIDKSSESAGSTDDANDLLVLEKLLEQGPPADVSTLTKEQKRVYKKFAGVIAANLKVKEDKVVFMSKDEFLSEGFSGILYEKFIKDINELNASLSLQDDAAIRQSILDKIPGKMEQIRAEIAKW
jgi:hypothetical protein